MKIRVILLFIEGRVILFFLYFKFIVELLIVDINIVNRLINVGAFV